MAELYPSPTLFNKALSERFEEFDFEASENTPKFFFADTSGKVYQNVCSQYMFRDLNKRFGDFLDLPKCIASRRMFVITYLEEEVVEKEIPVQDPIFVQCAPSEEVVPKEVALEEDEAPVVFDKEYAEGLYDNSNKADSKNALEEYGLKFGIDLNKAMKFSNMLIRLEEHVEPTK